MKEMVKTPTLDFYGKLEEAFNFYNEKLFDNELPPVFFTVRSGETKDKLTTTMGYYWKKIMAHKNSPISEIALNITTFSRRSTIQILSTLVHEMTHQWRAEICKEIEEKKYGGHDEIWGNKMMQIGLIPTNTGLPGGRKTGKKMTHYIDENGKFSEVSKELIKSGFDIDVFDSYGNRVNSTNRNISAINVAIEKIWLENETEESKEILKKALSVISDDKNIVQIDMNDLTVQMKPKKVKDKKIKFICPNCKTAIMSNENFKALCLNCEEVFEPKINK